MKTLCFPLNDIWQYTENITVLLYILYAGLTISNKYMVIPLFWLVKYIEALIKQIGIYQ